MSLSGALERGEVVGIDLQRALKRLERLGALAEARERQTVERPELWIAGAFRSAVRLRSTASRSPARRAAVIASTAAVV